MRNNSGFNISDCDGIAGENVGTQTRAFRISRTIQVFQHLIFMLLQRRELSMLVALCGIDYEIISFLYLLLVQDICEIRFIDYHF